MEYLIINKDDVFDWLRVIEINEKDSICIVDHSVKNFIQQSEVDASSSDDITHAGLLFYESHSFRSCSLASVNWHFLNPDSQTKVTSWKATAHVIIFRKGILASLEVCKEYSQIHIQAADLAYQALTRGSTVFHNPKLIKPYVYKPCKVQAGRHDEIRFVVRNLGRKNLLVISPFAFITSVFLNVTPRSVLMPLTRTNLTHADRQKWIESYSAIIPTINRYEYLSKAIHSLLNNIRPPAEIIVIDQTPLDKRIPGYYDEFSDAPVKVIFIEKAGQCTARNRAVQEASYEWLLLFDDDSEAWPEMMTEHIRLLEHSTAHISTGVSLAPWKDRSYIRAAISFYHVSAVMDTGNCFIRKKAIEDVGMFDLAFDRGSGADDNLGKRLYLKGNTIVFNPHAIRTHYKASTGGLRQHGAWWKNKGTLWGPLPLPTESYNFLTFYPRNYYLRLCLYKLITSYRRSGKGQSIVNTILFPWKVFQSYRKALLLLRGK
jgi:GT2 family glycosyltransferase